MKYFLVLLLCLSCSPGSPTTLSNSSELNPTYYDKNHGVVCYTTYDESAISCLQLNK